MIHLPMNQLPLEQSRVVLLTPEFSLEEAYKMFPPIPQAKALLKFSQPLSEWEPVLRLVAESRLQEP